MNFICQRDRQAVVVVVENARDNICDVCACDLDRGGAVHQGWGGGCGGGGGGGGGGGSFCYPTVARFGVEGLLLL